VVLAALDMPLTIAFDLLRRPEAWRDAGRFAQAVNNYPDSAPAVQFFLEEYIPAGQASRRRLLNPYFDKLFVFRLDPALRAMFGAKTSGIDWEKVDREKQTVLIDCRGETNQQMKHFKLLWVLSGILDYIRLRGRRPYPLGLILDEFSDFSSHMSTGDNPLVGLLEEFLNIYQRNHRIYFTCSYQSIFQIPESLRNSLLGLGNLVVGKPLTMNEARVLSDLLFLRDPNRVQHYRRIWGSHTFRYSGTTAHYVIDEEPVYMRLDAQLELSAQQLYRQRIFEFMLRPSTLHGDGAATAVPISIERVIQDPVTGECRPPDEAMLSAFRSLLKEQSGVPIKTLLAEQDALVQHVSGGHAPGRHLPGGNQKPGTAPKQHEPEPQQPRRTIQRRRLVS
jgi:hypothetical protein